MVHFQIGRFCLYFPPQIGSFNALSEEVNSRSLHADWLDGNEGVLHVSYGKARRAGTGSIGGKTF